MANGNKKLELTWIGKNERTRTEPRILLEDPTKSFHAKKRYSEQDHYNNRIVYGDNLLGLKALEHEFSGKFKCIYIDPPFNTQQAFENYDDGLEHSIWLSLMRDRLELLKTLLHDNGTLFIHIDDNELGYLIALADEVFGRINRVSIITFKQGSATGHKSINPGCITNTNFLLMYCKKRSTWKPNRVFTKRERNVRYNQFIRNRNKGFENWEIIPLTHAFAEKNGIEPKSLKRLIPDLEKKMDEFVFENADSVVQLARPDYDSVSKDARRMIDESKENPSKIIHLSRDGYSDMYFLKGERIIFFRDTLKEIDGELVPGEPLTTLWDDIPSHNLHNEGDVDFPKGKKPEGLIKRCLEISTEIGDWVLDSFGGSGTTGAVAHKMGRQWIMVEMGEHCHTHIIPRLTNIINGSDLGGVSNAVNWKGGGGFRYFKLAPSLLKKDSFGNWIISEKYNPEMVAEAVCKLEGFQFDPSDTVYWIHGRSTEKDFIYVTTQSLGADELEKLSDEVGNGRTLLVCCGAFRIKDQNQFKNLTLKKIPKAELNKCEWGQDDYSLSIKELSEIELKETDKETEQTSLFEKAKDKKKVKK